MSRPGTVEARLIAQVNDTRLRRHGEMKLRMRPNRTPHPASQRWLPRVSAKALIDCPTQDTVPPINIEIWGKGALMRQQNEKGFFSQTPVSPQAVYFSFLNSFSYILLLISYSCYLLFLRFLSSFLFPFVLSSCFSLRASFFVPLWCFFCVLHSLFCLLPTLKAILSIW